MIYTLEKYKCNRPNKVIQWFLGSQTWSINTYICFNLCDTSKSSKSTKGSHKYVHVHNGSQSVFVFVFLTSFFSIHPFHSKSNKKKNKKTLHTFYSDILNPPCWSFEKTKCFLVHGWTLKAKSASECKLLSERRSGSLRSSLVKTAASLAWFFMIRPRSARMRLSCSASTEFMSSIPDRSAKKKGRERKGWEKRC